MGSDSVVNAYNLTRGANEALNVLPYGTESNIGEIRNMLFDGSYTPVLNAFVPTLVNRIFYTIVRNKIYNNDVLKVFHKGSVPLGTDIQDLYINPTEGIDYELSENAMSRILKLYVPETHAAYYRMNSQKSYPKTISKPALKGAFTSWENLGNYITSITNSQYSGNYIYCYRTVLEMLKNVAESGKVLTQVVGDLSTTDDLETFVQGIKTLYTNMSNPSENYNNFNRMYAKNEKIVTWTNKDRFVLILNSEVSSKIDVKVLAKAFNLSYADFIGHTIEVDNFGNPDIYGFLMDEAYLQIYENLLSYETDYNGGTMAYNTFLHSWNTFGICPFANCICFVKNAIIKPSAITIPTLTDLAVDATKEYTVTTTPTDANAHILFTAQDPTKLKVEKTGAKKFKVTGLEAGDTKVKADCGSVTASADIKVTES